ncbi:MAG: DUF438 domain-containing protein [Candidatus Izemoplasmatales bacterium]|nr:DUF438 domain-containing protein [Candidatus Izemoplasmatales bacterium]
MSEFINNQTKRKQQLQSLIKEIHQGLPLEEAKQQFKQDFGTVTTEEIVELEQSLMEEGMPVSEVQRLCDVHAALFEGSIEDIHRPQSVLDIPGHPAQVLAEENRAILSLIEFEIRPYLPIQGNSDVLMLRVGMERLAQVSNHYSRKEYLFFPILEKRGITSIPQVMWGVDDEIRAKIKASLQALSDPQVAFSTSENLVLRALEQVTDMVSKESNVLVPKLIETLKDSEWIRVDLASEEIGYFLEAPQQKWVEKAMSESLEVTNNPEGEIAFDAGTLLPVEINAILNTLPLDMTFVDKEGHVKYFTQGKERIFHRPKTILGRHVNQCHPPKSVHIVESIVASFASGQKEHEDFHIQMGDKMVHIRYFAIRSPQGEFLGTLEVTQDITPIRALQGEKRLVETT